MNTNAIVSPKEIYESLVASITDEDELAVFECLLNTDEERVTREALIQAVFPDPDPVPATSDQLAMSTKDRKVRAIIRRLRDRDYPIVSSSDKAGYSMKASEAEMEKFIAQQQSRVNNLLSNINKARRAKKLMGLVHRYRSAKAPKQLSFIQGQSV